MTGTDCRRCGRRLLRSNRTATCRDSRTCDLPPKTVPGVSWYVPWIGAAQAGHVAADDRPELEHVTYDERGHVLNAERAARVAMLQGGWSQDAAGEAA
jgi:hypothetical protein